MDLEAEIDLRHKHVGLQVDVVAQVELVAVPEAVTMIDQAAAVEVVPRVDVEVADAVTSMAIFPVWIPSPDVFKRLLGPHLICPQLILQKNSFPEGLGCTSETCPPILTSRR